MVKYLRIVNIYYRNRYFLKTDLKITAFRCIVQFNAKKKMSRNICIWENCVIFNLFGFQFLDKVVDVIFLGGTPELFFHHVFYKIFDPGTIFLLCFY